MHGGSRRGGEPFLVRGMNPLWKARLIAFASAMLAVVVGWWVAHGSYALPLMVGAVAGAAVLVKLLRLPFDVIVLGGLVVGYVVGNRGFAQISLLPGLPLLPAEAGLAVCLGWLLVTAAFRRTLPLQSDAMNVAVALWIVVGSARILPDVRAHGASALRDFATVYYALFFYVAQAQARSARTRAFLESCLRWATVVIIPISELFRRFPDFFIRTLAVGGIPMIFFKGDLVATFMAMGVLLSHRRWEVTRRIGWLVAALLGVIGVLGSENRASLLGLAVATGWLAIGRQWGLLRLQLAGAAAAGLLLLGGIVCGIVPARDNAALRLCERVASMVDVAGTRAYDSTDVEFKGDNNRFRLVWWQTVVEETIDRDPWFGLGFGYDLAAAFLQRYYPGSDEEFSTRSPHSILLTAFGRTGLVGLAALAGIVVTMAWRTWRTLHTDERHSAAQSYWMAAWVLFTSACFGVVLEGPMGAVVFWTVLGLANASSAATPDERDADTAAPAKIDADLRRAPTVGDVAAPP